jgi:outer membrane protein assembly factor BamB
MTKVFSKKSITAIAISTLFMLSPLGAASLLTPASASTPSTLAPAPLTQLQANWSYPNGNALGQDYNPQTLINSTSAQYLGLSWLFPLPAHPTALLSVSGGLGVDTALLIINGTIYATGQDGQVFALNATDGNQLWTDVLPLDANSTTGMGAGAISLHLHDGPEQFTTATIGSKITGPTYWIDAPDHIVWAINAKTGAYEMNFSDYGMCTPSSLSSSQPIQTGGSVNKAGDIVGNAAVCGVTEIPGNNPTDVYTSLATNILIDQAKGTMITSMLSSSDANAARCYYEQWNIAVSPPTVNWITFCSPPEPGSNTPVNPNWDVNQVNSMSGAEVFYPGPAYASGGAIPSTAEVNLKTLSSSQLNATLYNDWGYVMSAACAAETGGASPGAVGAGWGGEWLLGTGPTAGMAFINTGNKGPYAGNCQPGPDLWASSILALNTTNGNWIWGFQTSAHDEWDFDCSWWQALGNETVNGVANTQVLWKTCKDGYLFELNAQTGNLIWAWTPPTSILDRLSGSLPLNPLNVTQMTEVFGCPTQLTTPCIVNPTTHAGFENEPSYDPALNMIFTASQNVPSLEQYVVANSSNYGKTSGFNLIGAAETTNDNCTVEGVYATNGTMAWSHYISEEGYRGGITSSGNVVFLTFSSGDILMLNAQTGVTVKDIFIGGPLNVIPSIGATSSGKEEVIFPITAGEVTWGTGVPGDIVALSLQSASTGPSGTASVSTSTTTVTSAAGTSTVTTTASATTVTSTTGVSSTTVYAIAAVAVIFIIATGYLAMRGRKPAS